MSKLGLSSICGLAGVLTVQLTGVAVSENLDYDFHLRGSVYRSEPSLKRKIEKASRWGLRNSRKVHLDGSLVSSAVVEEIDIGSLRGFLSTSLNRSNRLKSAIHEANAAHYSAQAEFSRLLPTVSFTAEIEREAQVNHPIGVHRELESRNSAITANWTVFSGGANWTAYKAAKHQAVTADLRYLAGERQVFVENAAIYLDLLGGKRLVQAIGETNARLKQIRNVIREQFRAGLASKTDIAQIDSEIASVEAELEAANSSLEQLKISYTTVVGIKPPKMLKIPNTSHIVPKTRKAALDRALSSNHLIDAAYSNQRAAQYRKRSIFGQFLPQVSLFATGQVNEFNYDKGRDDYDWSVGARLTVPLVNAATVPRYLEAKERAISADYQVGDTQWNVSREVESTWTSYQSTKRQKSALVRKSQSIKRALHGMRKELEVGLRPISDVLREEIKFAQNKVEIIRVDSSMALSAFKLAAQFSDMDLSEIAPL